MTKANFIFICNQHTIDPKIALENKKVHDLVKADKHKNTVHAQLTLNTLLKLEF